MSPERLLQNFDRLIDAPDAVPRLRRFILDLAVRGKLVKQTPEDEPAAELLKRIEAEKKRLEKKEKTQPKIKADEVPFTLFDNLVLVRLGEIAAVEKGITGIQKASPGPYPLVSLASERSTSDKYQFDASAAIVPLISSTGHGHASMKRLHYQEGKFALGNILCAVVPYCPEIVSARYLYEYLTAYKDDLLVTKMLGTANVSLTMSKITEVPVPLITPKSQQRFGELMALCDELETAQTKRERRRDRLVVATLHGLNNGDSDSETIERLPFEDSARFYFNHLSRLTTRPEHIQQLRQTILNLAVRGKLVEQNPKDEPAAELLKRIEVEKTRLVKEGKIRKDKPLSLTEEETKPFGLPKFWEWVPIRKITADRGQKIPDKKFSYIDVSAIDKERGKIGEPLVLTPDAAPSRARKIVQQGDVIYSCVRPYLLNIAVVDKDFKPEPIVSTAFAVLNGLGFVLPRYLWIVLRSPYFVSCVEEKMRGQAYPAINDSDFAPLPVPLPPLAEQHWIVAKVEELMALCDEMEGWITTNMTTSRKLLEATLQEAF